MNSGAIGKLKARLKKFRPLIFVSSEREVVRVMEKSGLVVCDISLRLANQKRYVEQIYSILSKAHEADQKRFSRLSIYLDQAALAIDRLSRALVVLIEMLGETVRVKLVIHVEQPRGDWCAIQTLAKSVRSRLGSQRELYIELIAPFGEIKGFEMEALFNAGIRIRFVAGWTKGCPPDKIAVVNEGVLRDLCEYGFRAPIEWYVHSGNIKACEEQIPVLLSANHYSGLSLSLVLSVSKVIEGEFIAIRDGGVDGG